MREDTVVVVLVTACAQARQPTQPDLLRRLDRADPRASPEILQVWLHDL
jgi:hypothetical protein